MRPISVGWPGPRTPAGTEPCSECAWSPAPGKCRGGGLTDTRDRRRDHHRARPCGVEQHRRRGLLRALVDAAAQLVGVLVAPDVDPVDPETRAGRAPAQC